MVNLPTAAGTTGKVMFMKKTDGGVNGITVDPEGAEMIDGTATASAGPQNATLTIVFHPISRLIIVLLLAGCTTVGMHDSAALRSIDFGPQQVVRLCAWLDEGITEVEARELLTKAWKHDAGKFELEMQIVQSRLFTRSGFTASAIAEQVIRLPLEDACDRVVVFVGRHAGDVLWGFLGLPEILGWANDVTRTHAYAVTKFGSLQQALFLPPSGVLRHELLHLLGCEHGWSLSTCYERIAEMKRAKRGDFFPAWDAINETILPSRASVAATLADRGSGQREAHKAR